MMTNDPLPNITPRIATIERATAETSIRLTLNLDGTGTAEVATGLGSLDHFLTILSFHARFDLELSCTGDLVVDDHHTVEDVALVLGQAIDRALGTRAGIARFASAYAPLDESLARVVIDLSGRPASVINLNLERDMLGQVATENFTHFFRSLATAMRAALHVDVLRGENDHHRAEAAFKACALALRMAVSRQTSVDVPSTKGTLT